MERTKKSSADRLYKAFIYVALITLAITIIIPVAWVFMASIKENSEFCRCVGKGTDGGLYAQFRGGHGAGSGAPFSRGASGGVCVIPF